MLPDYLIGYRILNRHYWKSITFTFLPRSFPPLWRGWSSYRAQKKISIIHLVGLFIICLISPVAMFEWIPFRPPSSHRFSTFGFLNQKLFQCDSRLTCDVFWHLSIMCFRLLTSCHYVFPWCVNKTWTGHIEVSECFWQTDSFKRRSHINICIFTWKQDGQSYKM